MNGHKNGGTIKNRIYRTIKVAPTTRAIRAALALSATMLALSGSGAALAGTCAVTGLNEVTCTGVFTNSVDTTVPVIDLVPDLTLVVGEDESTTVNPPAGTTGVTSTWGGDATVINYAEINTSGADGIYMDSDDTATVDNYGSVYTYATGGGQSAVDVSAYNDATVVNGGDLTTQAGTGTGYNVDGVEIYSQNGSANVDNQASGSIAANSYNGYAVGVNVSYSYGANINNDGDISASSFNGNAIGIEVFNVDGTVSVTNGGTVEAYSLTGNTSGVSVFTVYGTATVNNSGGIYVGGDGYAEGISAEALGSTAYVDNSGTIEVTSYQSGASGINAYGKYADIDNSGDITVNGYTAGSGIQVYGAYGVTVNSTGNITVNVVGPGADASGINVTSGGYINIYNGGDITVTSSGDGGGALLPYSESANGVGISAVSQYSEGGEQPPSLLYGPTDVNVVNAGNVVVNVGGNGIGMYGATFGTGSVYMDNSGTVTVDAGGYAAGMVGLSDSGTVEVQNSGSINVDAFNGGAYGVYAYTTSFDGDVLVNSSGSIDAYSEYDVSFGIDAQTTGDYADINIDASGSISSYSKYDESNGIYATASGYESDISLSSGATLYSGSETGNAFGIYVVATGDFGNTYALLTDASDITAYSQNGQAAGVVVGSTGYASSAELDNYGDIYAHSVNNTAVGFEVVTQGDYGNAYAYNSGDVSAYSGTAQAVGGAVITQGYDADIVFGNNGSIGAYGEITAVGVEAVASGDESQIDFANTGQIIASSYSGTALGALVETGGIDGDIAVYNSGFVHATVGTGTAIGFEVVTLGDYADIYMHGDGDVTSYAFSGVATGILANVGGYESNIYVGSGGTMDVTSLDNVATGISATNDTDSGYLTVDNSGDITVYGYDVATGINADGNGYGDTTVNSSGSITVTSGFDSATGIDAYTYQANVSVDNSGDVTVGGFYNAYGIDAFAEGDGDVTVSNSGTIAATANAAEADGIYAYANGDGAVNVTNSGSVTATSFANYASAFAIYTYANGEGDVTMTNTGYVRAVALGDNNSAYGIRGNTDGSYGGDMFVYNEGSVYAYSLNGGAQGIYVDANGDGADITVNSSGSVVAIGYDNAIGINSDMDDYGATDITNSGFVGAYSNYGATGINATTDGESNYSPISIDNSGNIVAQSYEGTATGIDAYAGGNNTVYGFYTDIDVDNSGSINAYSEYGDANGVVAAAGGNFADIVINNSGDVVVDGYGNAFGLSGTAGGVGGEVDVYNTGSVTVTATGYSAAAVGVFASSDYSFVYQGGSVSASAFGSAFGSATGVYVRGDYFSNLTTGYGSSTDAYASGYFAAIAEGAHLSGEVAGVYNEGAISATAYAEGATGEAYAYGVSVNAYDASVFLNDDSDVSATATGGDYVLAIGVKVNADNIDFYNSGSVDGYAAGVVGYAVGVALQGANSFTAYNYGSISAEAYGDGVEAFGLFASSDLGDIGVVNDGDITASSDYFAIGVSIETDGYGYVLNNGTIEASGDGDNVAIWSQGLSDDEILNYGTVTGAIWAGDGDDFFFNGEDAVWNPGQTTSYFAGGDDTITNDGTINMDDSSIDMGYYSANGNYFYNYGTINVSGAANYINMGGPIALVPSLNPNAFYNGGVIDFQDGAPDDMLTITGDFAGDGDINVDVSGLDGVSDVLYIDGSVVTGTVGVINVDLLDLPETIETLIPIVYVTGDSVDGNFVLGDINWDDINTFVTLDFGIVSDIDATNATPDVFSLGIQVTGLSDPGTLAASISPSVMSLMNTQVGTWRQRAGVIDSFSKGGVSLWARVFTDKGSFTPEHDASNFGNGGNFDWDQKNSGAEAGIDFSVTDEFSLGLLVAKSQSDTHLDNPGSGSADIDADTWGVYGTWISPSGFYLDASYRWMSFDADLDSVAGSMETSGDAESFNVELGYAWTLAGGLKIEPQLQYTKTNVDNIDAVSTTTGMVFSGEGGDSSRGRLGVAIRKSFGDADAGWQWTPYATLSAVREFDGESSYAVNNTFVGTTSIEGTSALLELGFTARHQGWAVFGGLNWQDGGAVNSFFGGQLGVRYTFGGAAPAPAPVAPPPAKTCADLDDDGDGVNNCDDKCLGSTAGQAVGPDGCPVPLTIDLKGVNFDFDKATLRPDAVAILDEAVAILGKYPDLKVEVAGHTDSIGTEQYNQGLSERRAQAVYDYLGQHGIDAGRLVGPNGYGETRPIAPNTNEDGSDNPEGRAKNRRTELNVQN